MEHILYRLEKIKIAFKYHQFINTKLYQPNFNYPKFYAINYFIQYIQDYDSMINYNITHSKAAHKYYLKMFFNKMNKKKYNL